MAWSWHGMPCRMTWRTWRRRLQPLPHAMPSHATPQMPYQRHLTPSHLPAESSLPISPSPMPQIDHMDGWRDFTFHPQNYPLPEMQVGSRLGTLDLAEQRHAGLG